MSDDNKPEQSLTMEEKRKEFGAKLLRMRTEKNLTVKDLVHLTRISPPFIDALENGLYDRLPGKVFGRGFIRSICKILEIDSKELLEEFDACWDFQQVKPTQSKISRGSKGSFLLQKKNKPVYQSQYKKNSIIPWLTKPILLPLFLVAVVLVLSLKFALTPDKPQQVVQTAPQIEETGAPTLVTSQPDPVDLQTDETSKFTEAPKEEPPEPKTIEITSQESEPQSPTQIQLQVLDPVKINLRIDGGQYKTIELAKGSYSYDF